MESVLHDLCDGLRGEVDLRVLVANGGFETKMESDDGVKVVRVGSLGEVFSTSICPSMPLWIKRFEADIVEIHHPNPMANLSYMMARPGGKLVVMYHSDIVRQQITYGLYYPWLMWMLRRADRIIVTSPNYLVSSTTLTKFRHKCAVIPLGIDLRKFERKGREREMAAIRAQYGERIMLFVGRLAQYKGLSHLLEAMKGVPGQLVIVGGGELEEELRVQTERNNLSKRVHFLGELREEQVMPFFHACDVFVLPSITRNEAFGLVQLEAMACCKPVVSTQLETGVPYVNQSGKTGIVVPPADSGALAEAMNRLLRDRDVRIRMGMEGRRRVERKFTRERMACETLQLYRELLTS